MTEDRWTQLRNYRKAKGLCFTCGEKWSKEHQCKSYVQLHVVQEMLEFLQLDVAQFFECEEPEKTDAGQAMYISATALGTENVEQTMQLFVETALIPF